MHLISRWGRLLLQLASRYSEKLHANMIKCALQQVSQLLT